MRIYESKRNELKQRLMNMKNDTKREWIVTAILLAISSLFGLAGFLVGRSAYGKTISKSGL